MKKPIPGRAWECWTPSGRCLPSQATSQHTLEEWRQKGHCYGCARRDGCCYHFQSNALHHQAEESTFICHLHPLVALTPLSPPLFTHWRKRGVLGRQFTQKCLLFKNSPFLFSCSICMGKKRQPASIAGEALKHWAQSVQSHKRGGEGASRAHSTCEFSEHFCRRNIIHSSLLSFYFLTGHKPIFVNFFFLMQLRARHWTSTRTELLRIHGTPSPLADDYIYYRPDSVPIEAGPAVTPQGSGAAPCLRYHQYLANHGCGCWARFSDVGSTISLANPEQLTTACFSLRHINSWSHWRHDLRHLLPTFWGGPELSRYGSYSLRCSWATKTEIQFSWSVRSLNFHNAPG